MLEYKTETTAADSIERDFLQLFHWSKPGMALISHHGVIPYGKYLELERDRISAIEGREAVILAHETRGVALFVNRVAGSKSLMYRQRRKMEQEENDILSDKQVRELI